MTYPKIVTNVVCICGSTRFKAEIMAANRDLTLAGKIVLAPGVFGHTDMPDYDWSTDGSDLKRKLDRLHFDKIDLANEVYVVNPGGYIGESTAREIEYARSQFKTISYLVPLDTPVGPVAAEGAGRPDDFCCRRPGGVA